MSWELYSSMYRKKIVQKQRSWGLHAKRIIEHLRLIIKEVSCHSILYVHVSYWTNAFHGPDNEKNYTPLRMV